jgi:hypothetical protein
MEVIQTLDEDDKDSALFNIIKFILSGRVPSDAVDTSMASTVETNYETLLQVEALTSRLGTDWMIYGVARDVADAIQSPKHRYTITVPQREDISRRFAAVAKDKLPIVRQITHNGYRTCTLAQTFRMRQAKPVEWFDLIAEAEALENVADRVYVLQIVALCLPKGMAAQRARLLDSVRQSIPRIPWQLDQIERYLGLAEDVQGTDSVLCRELLDLAATAISTSGSDDVAEQRRRIVDVAYRMDQGFANKLIDAFDDDEAKRHAQTQVRLLDIRKTITEGEGKLDQSKVLDRIRSNDIARLGLMLGKALNAGRVQTYHPSEIRHYLELTADQPLTRTYSMLMWYIDNAVIRFAQTEQAVTFLRPMLSACIIGAQLAGQIAGQAMIRLKALKNQSNELSCSHSLMVDPGSREEAVRILSAWFEQRLTDEVKLHDQYFSPEELSWLQIIRSAKPSCRILVITSRLHQPPVAAGEDLGDVYARAWRRLYDQDPPRAEIVIIGGEASKESPIHDRWIVSGGVGLRLGTSLNSLGRTKDSEISEMSSADCEQRAAEMDQYLHREKTEFKGERLRLSRFWLC